MVLSKSVRVLLWNAQRNLWDHMAVGVELLSARGRLVAFHLEGFVVGLPYEHLCSIDLSMGLVTLSLWAYLKIEALRRVCLAKLLLKSGCAE